MSKFPILFLLCLAACAANIEDDLPAPESLAAPLRSAGGPGTVPQNVRLVNGFDPALGEQNTLTWDAPADESIVLDDEEYWLAGYRCDLFRYGIRVTTLEGRDVCTYFNPIAIEELGLSNRGVGEGLAGGLYTFRIAALYAGPITVAPNGVLTQELAISEIEELNFKVIDPGDLSISVEYTPSAGAPRETYWMPDTVTDSDLITFHFDEAAGSFQHRQGGACTPTQDNPDAVVYNIRALDGDLIRCSVQASWDANKFECPPSIIDLINSEAGLTMTLNTDSFRTDPADLCAFTDEPHFAHDSEVSLDIQLETESKAVLRRLHFYKAPLP